MGDLQVIVDGQYGSCGKGAVTAALIKRYTAEHTDTAGRLAIRVAGPNAGHTVIGDKGVDTSPSLVAPHLCETLELPTRRQDVDGETLGAPGRFAWRLRHIPVAAVADENALLALAAGSELDLDVLLDEIDWLEAAGYKVRDRLLIDEQATVIDPVFDQEAERGIRSGTTGKGIGSARSRRLLRDETACLATNAGAMDRLAAAGVEVRSANAGGVAQVAAGLLRGSGTLVQIEGTQGFGLGLHSGFYPYTTSSDCRAVDFLAMAGISPWMNTSLGVGYWPPRLEVWVCLRPYPIRIAGNSGPLRGETTWEALGLDPEITTVTRKTRRVGAWDGALARAAIRANGGPGEPVRVALTMFDQIAKSLAGVDTTDPVQAHDELVKAGAQSMLSYYSAEVGQPISYLGTGPDSGIWP